MDIISHRVRSRRVALRLYVVSSPPFMITRPSLFNGPINITKLTAICDNHIRLQGFNCLNGVWATRLRNARIGKYVDYEVSYIESF